MIAGALQSVLPAPASTTTTEAPATKAAAATETTATAAEVLESALSPLGRTIGDEHESDQRPEVVVAGIRPHYKTHNQNRKKEQKSKKEKCDDHSCSTQRSDRLVPLDFTTGQWSNHDEGISNSPCVGVGTTNLELWNHLIVNDSIDCRIGKDPLKAIAHSDEHLATASFGFW